VGYDQGGQLTNAIKANPFSIVLFDEIEKASDKVYQLLLQIMDEGRLTDGKGNKISFKDVVVIMTSNVGVDEMLKVTKTMGFGSVNVLTEEKKDKAIDTALKKTFKPEFLNRLTSIINFRDLDKDDYIEIIKLELEKMSFNLKVSKTDYSNLKLLFDKSLYDFIYSKGIDITFGARPLKRTIEKEISSVLAHKLLFEEVEKQSEVKMFFKNDKLSIIINSLNKEPDSIVDPPFYMRANNE
jgi:ATP-dependent Clp protease ATP-binding subunit ClpC